MFLHMTYPVATVMFTRTNTAHKINTRFSVFNFLHKFRIVRKMFITHAGCMLWNNLSLDLRVCNNMFLVNFKAKVKYCFLSFYV